MKNHDIKTVELCGLCEFLQLYTHIHKNCSVLKFDLWTEDGQALSIKSSKYNRRILIRIWKVLIK